MSVTSSIDEGEQEALIDDTQMHDSLNWRLA